MQEWVVLFTKPNAEFVALAALRSRDLEAYLPTIPNRASARHGGKQPLFPRYIFVHADLRETPSDVLHWTPGLARPFMIGDTYARISQEAVDLVREQAGEVEAQGGLPTHAFRPGQQVRIRSGPLQGLYGVFDGQRKARERVTILVDFLKRTNRVEIPVDDLEAANKTPSRHPARRTRGRGRRIRSVSTPRSADREGNSR